MISEYASDVLHAQRVGSNNSLQKRLSNAVVSENMSLLEIATSQLVAQSHPIIVDLGRGVERYEELHEIVERVTNDGDGK